MVLVSRIKRKLRRRSTQPSNFFCPPFQISKIRTLTPLSQTFKGDALKRPAFQFYPGDWLKDPALALCTPATRGVWIDLLCAMHELGRSGELCGTLDQLSRTARCSTAELAQAITDLQTTGAADVTERNGKITLANRRMKREARNRESGAVRAKNYRNKGGQKDASRTNNAEVTPPSSSSSSDPPYTPPTKQPEFRTVSPVLYAAMEITTPSMREEGQAFETWQELKAMGATAEEFAARARRYREVWPDMAFTFAAVMKHWSQMAPPKPKRGPVVPVVDYVPDSLLPEATDG
jgi:hypothetical protein